MDLEELRHRIDELDEKLVTLLNERAVCAHQIGEVKRKLNLAIYEPRREQVVFDNIRRYNHGPLPNTDLIGVYERILDVMRKIQRDEISPTMEDDLAKGRSIAPEIEPND